MFNFLKSNASKLAKINNNIKFTNWDIRRLNDYINKAIKNRNAAVKRGNTHMANHYMTTIKNHRIIRNAHIKNLANLRSKRSKL